MKNACAYVSKTSNNPLIFNASSYVRPYLWQSYPYNCHRALPCFSYRLRFRFTHSLTVARLYTVLYSIHEASSFSKHIHGKYGNFISAFCKMSNAFCLNITSCDKAISVIIVVLRFPILPQVIETIGRAFINPQFFASHLRSLLSANFLRQCSNKT